MRETLRMAALIAIAIGPAQALAGDRTRDGGPATFVGDGRSHPIGTRFGTGLDEMAAFADRSGHRPFAWMADDRFGLRFTLNVSSAGAAPDRLEFAIVPGGVPVEPAIAAFNGDPANGQHALRIGMGVSGRCIARGTVVAGFDREARMVTLSQGAAAPCRVGEPIVFSIGPDELHAIEADWLAAETAIADDSERGGTVHLPAGTLMMGAQSLVVPPIANAHDQIGQVEIAGDGMAATMLVWPRDLGPGRCAMGDLQRPAVPVPSYAMYRDLKLQGPGTPNFAGGPVAGMDGLCIGHGAHVDRVVAIRFHAGLSVLGDHQVVRDAVFGLDHYGIYLAPFGGNYGNLSLENVGLIANATAGLAVSWGSMLDASLLRNVDMTVEPIGLYKEAPPPGMTAGRVSSFVSNSLFEAVRGEQLGSGLLVDDGSDDIDNNDFIDVEPSMAAGYRLAGHGAPDHAITAGHAFTRNVFVHSDIGDKGNESAVTGALIESRLVAGNDFGVAPVGLTGARPFVAAAAVSENRIATADATGTLRRAAGAIVGGTAVMCDGASVGARTGNAAACGVALQDAAAGGVVPVVVTGDAPMRPDADLHGVGVAIGPSTVPGRVAVALSR